MTESKKLYLTKKLKLKTSIGKTCNCSNYTHTIYLNLKPPEYFVNYTTFIKYYQINKTTNYITYMNIICPFSTRIICTYYTYIRIKLKRSLFSENQEKSHLIFFILFLKPFNYTYYSPITV